MKNRHNQIWARIGMTFSLTPDEMELLVSGNDLDKRKCLSRIFTEGRAVVMVTAIFQILLWRSITKPMERIMTAGTLI